MILLTITSQTKRIIMKMVFIPFILSFIAAGSTNESGEAMPEEGLPTEQILTLTEAQMKSAAIQLGKLEQKDISSTILVNGKIEVPPQNMVSVSMPLGGYLKSTQLLPGMHVAKGQVIASMEDLQYIQLQQEYLTAKSKLQYTETEFNRQKELNQSKASSDKIFQQSQMEYESLKITLSALAEKLKLININPVSLTEANLSKAVNIYSPIDGFVSKVNVNIGKYVNPSDILFELVNPSDIHLNLKIFEKDLEKLYIGQKLMAYTNNKPNEKHPCEIILISMDISNERTAEVHCHFEDYDKTLLPGMYMNAEIHIFSKKALVIADEAIVSFEGKEYVFVAKTKNTFEMTEVKKGISEANYSEITASEPSADLNGSIVTKGAYSLLMQLKNKPEE
jgi:cobalt-zinc-cadmium efflux system membrane fusion protein